MIGTAHRVARHGKLRRLDRVGRANPLATRPDWWALWLL